MLELSERNFMEFSKNINKIVDYISVAALIAILLLLTNGNILLFATCPILLSLVYLTKGFKEFALSSFMAILLGLLFINPKAIAFDLVPIFLISILFILLIRLGISDKQQIFISFIVLSIIFIVVYKLAMVDAGMNISKLAKEIYNDLEISTTYDLKLEYIEASFALYPAMLATISLIYSLLGLKIIKNFLSFKNMGKDMAPLALIRLSKKDFAKIVIGATAIYFIASFLGFKELYIRLNLMWIILIILFFNGMGVYDYLLRRRQSLLSRGLQWFFIIIFFYIFAIFFIILGFADIFLDIRRKPRRSYGQF